MQDPAPASPSPLRRVLGIAVALAGGVFVLQGLGILTAGRSFMIGDPTWAVIGAVMIAGGLLLAAGRPRRA